MNIITVPIDTVIPYANNPRINTITVPKVVKSLKDFGWQQPIVVDKQMVIIAGHTRFLAAKELNMTEVPVVIADLSEAKANAYRIADNKVAEHSDWNIELLTFELHLLEDTHGSIDETDFTWEELDVLSGIGDGKDKPTKTTPDGDLRDFHEGDIWDLGGNELKIVNEGSAEALNKMLDAFDKNSNVPAALLSRAPLVETTPE